MMPVIHDPSKPRTQLAALARSLGWRGLELWGQAIDDGRVVHWYETSDPKFMLFITEYPLGQDDVFAATVYADRYGLCSGAHRFALSDAASLAALAPWIARPLFRDPRWRRELRRLRPECTVERPTRLRCNQKRVLGEWPPYEASEPKPSPP